MEAPDLHNSITLTIYHYIIFLKETMDADKAKYTLPDGSTLDVSETNMSRSIVASLFLEYNKNFSNNVFFSVAWPVTISGARTTI